MGGSTQIKGGLYYFTEICVTAKVVIRKNIDKLFDVI